jgi:hypothetical protein
MTSSVLRHLLPIRHRGVLADPGTGVARVPARSGAFAGPFSPDGAWLAMAVENGKGLSARLLELSSNHATTFPRERFVGWTLAG